MKKRIMITHLSINNFATVEQIEADFHPGLTVITGETGAGKSVIIDAVSLGLGSRADTAMVRTGQKKALIQLVTEFNGEEIILTREISASGKSIAKIDGEIFSLAQLSAFSREIADIHGQYDHHSLFRTENHLRLIDAYHSKTIAPARQKVADVYEDYSKTGRELSVLLRGEADAERRLDFMRFELDEIEKARPLPGEDDELREQMALLQNSEAIYGSLSAAYEALFENSPSISGELGEVLQKLREVSPFSEKLRDMEAVISDCYYSLESLSSEMRAYRESMDFSSETLDRTVARLDTLERLNAKYGGSTAKVLEYREKLLRELGNAESAGEQKAVLEERLTALKDELSALSAKLRGLRLASAEELARKINAELEGLNFKNARFEVRFNEIENIPGAFSENGFDTLEFLISANKGQPLLPLVKIASGGEMSRMMLAFKAVIGDYDRIPTMIFDEIDSGVSGVTASVVGEKLRRMSKNHQIICITHLPQIASCGEHHYMIQKSDDGEMTRTTLLPLEGEERVMEVARLLGGSNITGKTCESARELIRFSSL
ncbi:MAG: DNA repair protein RecN [Clostridiales Family XIII bacterium]|jgi:DNA repair protein RecN (Recombination protein N)|nr:DNA repair protein RecN [Clostridiales Family XIII bacterium]